MLGAPLPRVSVGLPLLVHVEVGQMIGFGDLKLFAGIVTVFFASLGSKIKLIDRSMLKLLNDEFINDVTRQGSMV